MASLVTTEKQPLPEGGSLRLGVDGEDLVARAMRTIFHDNPFWALTDAIPPQLPETLAQSVFDLLKHSSYIIIVFPGLRSAFYDPPGSITQTIHRDTWGKDVLSARDRISEQKAALLQSEGPTTTQFQRLLLDEDALQWIKRFLGTISPNVEVATAPYLAWSQLVYFNVSGVVDMIRGPEEVLACAPASHVLTMKVFGNKIGSMGDFFKPIPGGVYTTEKHLNELLRRQTEFSHHYRLRLPTLPVNFLFVDCPVMTLEGMVKPLSKSHPSISDAQTPSHYLKMIFHANLGNDPTVPLYWGLFSNVLTPSLLQTLATGFIMDPAPILQSKDFDDTMTRIMPLRAQIVYQQLNCIPDGSDMFALSWQKTHVTPPQTIPICKPPPIVLDGWDVDDRKIALEPPLSLVQATLVDRPPSRFNPATAALYFATRAHSSEKSVVAGTPDELCTMTMLKSLDLLGYFTHAAHAPNMEESSCSVYSVALKHCLNFPEEGVLLIELLRTRTLTPVNKSDELSFQGVPQAAPQQGPHMALALAVRILSLLNIRNLGKVYDGPPNPYVAAFVAQVRAFQRHLRCLHDVVLANLMADLARMNEMPDSMGPETSVRLPFGRPISTLAGTLAGAILHIARQDKPELQGDGRLSALSTHFPCIGGNMKQIVETMSHFWDAAVAALNELLGEPAGADLINLLREANTYVTRSFATVLSLPLP